MTVQKRCGGAILFTGLASVGLSAYLYCLQVKDTNYHLVKAEKVWERVTKLTGPRGAIFSRRGTLLAVSRWTERLEVNASELTDPLGLAQELTALLSDRQVAKEVTSRLRDLARKKQMGTKGKSHWVCLTRRLSQRDSQAIGEAIRNTRDHQWRALALSPDQNRIYPLKRCASTVLGFTNSDGKGQYGIEGAWDDVLRGREIRIERSVDGRGRPIDLLDDPFSAPPPGRSLFLTLDDDIQSVLEATLDRAMENHKPLSAMGIVMDPRTGDILALASKPDFDPNQFNRYPYHAFINRAISHVFEPGSSIKPLIAAILLDRHSVSDRTVVSCNGVWKEGPMTIRCWVAQKGAAPHGRVNLKEALRHSCNIAMAKMSLMISYDGLREGLLRLGLGRRLCLQAGREESGWIDPPTRYQTRSQRRHVQATMGFGQGLAVTVAQLAVAYCALANYGVVMKPRLILGIRDDSIGSVEWIPPEPVGRALSALTTQRITDYLVAVVESGTGKRARLPAVSVAGKTGTATKFYRGRYDPNRVVLSFFGYFPADSPRYVIGIVLDEPRHGQWGGEVCAPLFSEVGAQILRRVFPPRPPSLSLSLTAPPFSPLSAFCPWSL